MDRGSQISSAGDFLLTDNATYRRLVDSLTEYAMFAISKEGTIQTWNFGAERIFGYAADEAVGKSVAILFTPQDMASDLLQRELSAARKGKKTYHDRRHLRKDGTIFRTTASVDPVYGFKGELVGFTKVIADHHAFYHEVQALADREQHLRLLIESLPQCLVFSLTVHGIFTSWNAAATRALGYNEGEILGHHYAKIFVAEDAENNVPALVLNRAAALGVVGEDRWFVRKDGSRFLGNESITAVPSLTGASASGFIHVAHDLTERIDYLEDLRQSLSVDYLTALPNRNIFTEHLNRALSGVKRRPAIQFAVLFIDLDRFKQVNDTFGHLVADRLLQETARRLERSVRAEDVVARLGGDEFAVLLNGIANSDDAHDAAERIAAEMRQPALIDSHSVRVSASIGLAMGNAQYLTAEDILNDADRAMYVAKSGGGAKSISYSRSIRSHAPTVDGELSHAVERNELRVYYQPLVELSSSRIVGFESLVRWEHPRYGLLNPSAFISKAEETQAIVAIDNWVLEQACFELARWQSYSVHHADLSMSVNFSTKHFLSPETVIGLTSILSRSGIAPTTLHLEITEQATLQHSVDVFALAANIRSLGVELHMDDFGVGFSSLWSLTELPVQALKIDRGFVAKIRESVGREIVRSIIHLAERLRLGVVAEGIETVEQREELVASGCHLGQGYLFSRPVDAAAAAMLVKESARLFRTS